MGTELPRSAGTELRRRLLAAGLFGVIRPGRGRAADAGWAALREPGAVALMRHALAPGFGDPPGWRADDCATQRNLSAAGRAQAGLAGDAFRAAGIPAATVLHSALCRCRETAELLRLGTPRHAGALDSFFGLPPERVAERTRALAALIGAAEGGLPMILVTHQVNITALTGVDTGSGEVVVVRREAPGAALARLRPA